MQPALGILVKTSNIILKCMFRVLPEVTVRGQYFASKFYKPAWNQASGMRNAKHVQPSSGLRTGRALATPGGLLYPG